MSQTVTVSILLLTCLGFVLQALAVDSDKCVQSFLNDAGDLNPERFQGYWYARYSYLPYRPGFRAIDTQSIYVYMPGSRRWNIAAGLSIIDGLCYRRVVNVTVDSPGTRLFKDFTYFHHVVATDCDNYAVALFCWGVNLAGKCENGDIQTIVLTRSPQDLRKTNVWGKVTADVKDCADPSQLTDVLQEHICACRDSDNITLGVGSTCPDRVPNV
ncbi:uncharacterized protein [Haliotis cracherodii]|uniref:uncharacterized protein isoform X2 n=1 Tax=Haliotis cracherodii TaxID=6455 RepID=UPI0039EC30C3